MYHIYHFYLEFAQISNNKLTFDFWKTHNIVYYWSYDVMNYVVGIYKACRLRFCFSVAACYGGALEGMGRLSAPEYVYSVLQCLLLTFINRPTPQSAFAMFHLACFLVLKVKQLVARRLNVWPFSDQLAPGLPTRLKTLKKKHRVHTRWICAMSHGRFSGVMAASFFIKSRHQKHGSWHMEKSISSHYFEELV